ncbi:MAG: hypothetical protein J6575_03620 [Bifidobacterium sp.]|nr:hypothetical protein [Bifidobacterium sp.]
MSGMKTYLVESSAWQQVIYAATVRASSKREELELMHGFLEKGGEMGLMNGSTDVRNLSEKATIIDGSERL